jgi:hypothetical protein
MTIAYIGECKTFGCDRIRSMTFAVWAIRVLEVMFFVGLVGSAVVVLISFYEDGKELFGKD